MGYIYKIINDINNKIYIGQTERDIKIRWKEHCTNKKNNLTIDKAINKYGALHFQIIQIEECNNNLLNDRERYWISYYDSYKNGYNNTYGGQIYHNTRLTDEQIKEIVDLWKNTNLSLSHVAKQLKHSIGTTKNYLLMNGITEQEIIERRYNQKKKSKKKNKQHYIFLNNKILTKQILEEKQKIIDLFKKGHALITISKETHHATSTITQILLKAGYTLDDINQNKNKKINNWKNIYCYSLTGELIKIYTNRKELLNDYNNKQIKLICNCCSGLKQTSLGLKWSYEPITFIENDIKLPKHYPKKCGKFTLNNELIEKYKSIHECAKNNNVSDATMSKYIKEQLILNGFFYKILS